LNLNQLGDLFMRTSSRQFLHYSRPRLSEELRSRLGSISLDPVQQDGQMAWVGIEREHLCFHNLYHIEVSQLDRILIGNAWVSGMNGFSSPMFHAIPIMPEYDGVLDELRVAIHEWLTRPSFYNTGKLINWIVWMRRHGINPVTVIHNHYRTLKHRLNYQRNLLDQVQEWAAVRQIDFWRA
jgi:hypothetical protein